MLAPFLILLLLGALDASSLLLQNLDVRHAAREGGRLAAVNTGSTGSIITLVCTGMDDDSNTVVELTGDSGSLGDELEVTVTKQAEIITGFTAWAFNPPVALSSTSTFRIESTPVSWSDGSMACP